MPRTRDGFLVRRFDNNQPPGFEGIADPVHTHFLNRIYDCDEIPASSAEIEILRSHPRGLNRHTGLGGLLVRFFETDSGRVEPRHIPSLLSQEHGVAALAHAHIKRVAGHSAPDRFYEQIVWLGVELRGFRVDGIVKLSLFFDESPSKFFDLRCCSICRQALCSNLYLEPGDGVSICWERG